MGKIGLVLEGGGMRGLYTSGVLDVMTEKGFHPDVICGTSAGVTFGVNLPSGQKGRVLRYNLAYSGNPDYISLRSFLKTGNMVNVDFAYHILPNVLDPFDNEAFMNSGTEFYATATDVQTGEPEYFFLEDCAAQMDIIRASASLPFLSTMVDVNGRKYLDGGIVANIPIEKCMSLGCDKIVVVLTRPRNYVMKGSLAPLGKIVYARYKKLIEAFSLRSARYNSCLQMIAQLEREGKVFVIAPDNNLDIARLETDKDKLMEVHNMGLRDATAIWDRLSAYLNSGLLSLN